MSGRKIVQIGVVPAGQFTAAFYLAVCDDGTAWQLPDRADSVWEQLPPIPQPKREHVEAAFDPLPKTGQDEQGNLAMRFSWGSGCGDASAEGDL